MRELRKANEILRLDEAFFAQAELDRRSKQKAQRPNQLWVSDFRERADRCFSTAA